MTSHPTAGPVRWLFADQLGPHFVDSADQPVLLVEAQSVFRRRRVHRRKAHLVLSALRHLARDRPGTTLVASDTYRQGLAELGRPVTVCAPTSYPARRLVSALEREGTARVLPARGFAVSQDQFASWAARRGAQRLLLEDFYRDVRRLHGILMDGEQPVGGRWNFDQENRQPPPRRSATLADAVQVEPPSWPVEDDIDAQVRADLDRWERDDGVEFLGEDGPRRFAVTHQEAVAALEHFVTRRLDAFGPFEDAMLARDPWMAHSLLSAPLNLGLLDPVVVAGRAEQAYRDGTARLASVEGFVRQVIGWRDYVWHLHWHLGEDYRERNALDAAAPLPQWFSSLDARGEVRARCLSTVLADVRREGWTHHIPRLMVLGNWALQRGYDPGELADWFSRSFVDGYDWVMVANVVGMSQHADAGVMATKPYVSGGAYIRRMSDLCSGCVYDPGTRVGPTACPFTTGYWAFLDRHAERFAANHRMAQPLAGLRRLADRQALVAQAARRGDAPP